MGRSLRTLGPGVRQRGRGPGTADRRLPFSGAGARVAARPPGPRLSMTTSHPPHPGALTVREAAAACHAGTLDADTLLRVMMRHDGWRVAATPDAHGRPKLTVLTAPSGDRILELFSDDEALATFLAGAPDEAGTEMVTVTGWDLFTRLPADAVATVNVDPGTSLKFSWAGDRIEVLRAWARTVRVEVALEDPDAVVDPFAILGGYDAWFMVARAGAEGHEVVLAPDDTRNLAAVFTADDHVDTFVEMLGDGLGEDPARMRYDGATLFALLERFDLDGLVFNPASDRPRALASGALAELVRGAERANGHAHH